MAPHRDGLSGEGRDGVDDGGDVVELALDGVVGAVATGAAAAPVNGERRDVASELVDEGPVGGVVVERAVDHHQWWPIAVGMWSSISLGDR